MLASAAAQAVRIAPEAMDETRFSQEGVRRLLPAGAAAKDLAGTEWGLRALAGDTPTVIALNSVTCPLSQKTGPTLARIEDAYAGKGVNFIHVNVSGLDSVADMKEHAKSLGLDGAYLNDSDLNLAGTLGAKTTTEVFVLDSARTLVYRGAINDQYGIGYTKPEATNHYLTDAIDAVLAGERPTVEATSAPGCLIKPESESRWAAGDVTYHGRIARIMADNCVSCHRENGVGPFRLDTYENVQKRAMMLGFVVEDGIMPPWFAAETPEAEGDWHPGWANNAALSDDDKRDLLAWLDSDMVKGDPDDHPVTQAIASAWQIGEPDLIVEMTEGVEIPADGYLDYQYVRIPDVVSEDKWVKAIEIKPSEPQVVHHVLAWNRERGERWEPISESRGEFDGYYAAYVPGNAVQVFPEGFARKLEAGDDITMQMHYTPNGRAVTDKTQIGFIFADEDELGPDGKPDHEVEVMGIANTWFRIPAGTRGHADTASVTLPAAIRVMSFLPHMHVRGQAFKYVATLPDGTVRTLLDVPAYDFNWQLRYELAEPIDLPAGTVIEVTGTFDNSKGNPANPDPESVVRWGDQTFEEMLLGYVEYYLMPEAQEQLAERDVERIRLTRFFRQLDRDGDGEVRREDVRERLRSVFDRFDRNGDGVMTLSEMLGENAGAE